MFPITVLKIYAVGALLKSGGHRSPANYFSRAKEEHIKLGLHRSDALQLAVRKATTSVTHGIEPARQSAPLDLAMVWRTEYPWEPVAGGLPLGGKLLVICGAFFCPRKIEISLALRKHVCVDEKARQVSWNLPFSKTDPKALGKVRVWECVCGGTLEKPCAFHAFDDHLKHLRARFSGTPLWEDLPLFPT